MNGPGHWIVPGVFYPRLGPGNSGGGREPALKYALVSDRFLTQYPAFKRKARTACVAELFPGGPPHADARPV